MLARTCLCGETYFHFAMDKPDKNGEIILWFLGETKNQTLPKGKNGLVTYITELVWLKTSENNILDTVSAIILSYLPLFQPQKTTHSSLWSFCWLGKVIYSSCNHIQPNICDIKQRNQRYMTAASCTKSMIHLNGTACEALTDLIG